MLMLLRRGSRIRQPIQTSSRFTIECIGAQNQ